MPPENEQELETTEVAVETVEAETTESLKEELQASDENEIEFEEADFSALTEQFENDGEEIPVETVVEETETPPEETPEEVAAETVKTAEEEVVEESVAEEEVAAEVVEETKEEAPEVQAAEPEPEPELKVPTKEELDGMYQQHRADTLPTLEKLFELTEEDAAALDEQPSKIIPKLAGQMMYDTMLSSYNAVLAALPSVVNRLISASNDANKAEGQFFDAWPDLAGSDKAQIVSAAIRSYRSTNPRANLETVIQKAGVLAMINAGLDPVAVKTVEEKKPAAKKAPAKPAAPRGTTQLVPPKKAGSEEENVFSELARLHDEDNA
jgi:hypothetical protein